MLRVRKRNGELEDVQFDKVTSRIRFLCEGRLRDGTIIGKPLNICYTNVAQDVISKIQDKVSTSELDEFAARFCAGLTKEDYQYGILGGRISASNHQKNTLASFVETMRFLYENKTPDGKSYPLIDKRMYKFIVAHRKDIEAMIDNSRDFNFDYFGFKTLQKSYLLRRLDNALNVTETPQHLYMREAIALCFGAVAGAAQGTAIPVEQILKNIKITYDYLSLGYYTHASPTMYNAGTHFQQLSSCFLLGIGDSMDDDGGIPDCWKACAQISKRAGGIGIGIQPIRAKGTLIAGTGGNSDGIVPLARVFNAIARYVNQGGRRPGAIALYQAPWHKDIFQFLQLRKNTGVEEERARDLFYALWVPDIFMRRVKEALANKSVRVNWSLMCPHLCEGLYTTYGAEFEKLYLQYEREGHFTTQIDILTLWYEILDSQKETGTPYMLYSDHVNHKNNQSNLGVIRNSNLCAEILEYSDESEYAVCNLASLSLSSFVVTDDTDESKNYFDFAMLHAVAKVAHQNLDRVIDINEYPMRECRRSNVRHRPVGLGVQGFADTLALLNLPFEDTIDESIHRRHINKTARRLNIAISATIYHACIEASMELARDREQGMQRLREYYLKGFISASDDGIDLRPVENALYSLANSTTDGSVKETPFSESELVSLIAQYRPILQELKRDKYLGAYSSFIGSPSSLGKLQYDLWSVTPDEGHLEGPGAFPLDWAKLKSDINTHGLRNSLVRADMPTASSSQIMGNCESTEPYKYCIYTRRVTAGEFVVVNKHLHKELYKIGMWNDDIKSQIIRERGSVQKITQLPRQVRDKYLTAYEIGKKTMQDYAADRAPYICQTQSTNYFVAQPTDSILTSIHIGAWDRGLKTGMYYLRREPKAHPVQYTTRGGLSVNAVETPAPAAAVSESSEKTVVAGPACAKDALSCESCSA